MHSKIHLGHKAKKRFGQNFLIDDFIIDNIIENIAYNSSGSIVEIGPGLGALTSRLKTLNSELTLIEIDKDLIARLEKVTQSWQQQPKLDLQGRERFQRVDQRRAGQLIVAPCRSRFG